MMADSAKLLLAAVLQTCLDVTCEEAKGGESQASPLAWSVTSVSILRVD